MKRTTKVEESVSNTAERKKRETIKENKKETTTEKEFKNKISLCNFYAGE